MDLPGDHLVLVYTTWPSAEHAEEAGETFIRMRFAACVNILPGMVSIYRWEDKIAREQEAVMIIKTRAHMVEALRIMVRDLHPYSVPAFLVLPVISADLEFSTWLLAQTR